MYKCPRCTQTIQELIPAKEDVSVLAKNLAEKVEFEKKKVEFQNQVNSHNESKRWFERWWYIEENYLFYYIEARCKINSYISLGVFKKIVDVTTKPQENNKTKYIECPACQYRKYLVAGDNGS